MNSKLSFRQYLVLTPTEEANRLYWDGSLEDLRRWLAEKLRDEKELDFLNDTEKFGVLAAPTREWSPRISGYEYDEEEKRRPSRLLLSCGFSDPGLLKLFRDAVARKKGELFLEFGADPGGALADHWCPGGPSQAVFGDRADAEAILEAEVLTDRGLDGAHVNVVVVDDGLSAAAIPPQNWGGGLAHGGVLPGEASPDSHGTLVARNILHLAPKAVLYDVPLIPPRITDIPSFTSREHSA